MVKARVELQETIAPGVARAKGPSIQELLDEETVEVPWVLRQDRYEFLGDEDIPADRYFSREFFDLEVEKLWPKVWQLACFEQDIPNVGDSIVYEIVDLSFLIVRSAPDEIKAFYNACLHRGRQLRDNDTVAACSPEIRCPFHGVAWNIDGSLREIPPSIAFDFPHVRPESFGLPEVRCERWDGLVFINMDEQAEPLLDFLGELTVHFERWPLAPRWKSSHRAKVMDCNWKVVQEAFIESMHVIATHPQMNAGLLGGDGSNCEYDVYENFSRSIMAPIMVNPNLPYELTERELIEELYYRGGAESEGLSFRPDVELDDLPPDLTARKLAAEASRRSGITRSATGELTDIELTSAIWYNVFPNWFPWSSALFYRFRPLGTDPDRSIMEIVTLVPVPDGQERPPAAPITWLGDNEMFGGIFNQDTENVALVQKGLKTLARGKPSKGVTLANYQDIRIRHMHKILDSYLAR